MLPDIADVNAICNTAAAAWNTDLAGLHSNSVTLTQVTAVDLSSETGVTTEGTYSHAGTRGTAYLPDDVAAVIAFHIAARYRGGHPKVYLPAGLESDVATLGQWGSTFIAAAQTGFSNFITAVLATSGLSITLDNHVGLSLYKGFRTTGPDAEGRLHYPPKYRDSAVTYNVTSYTCSKTIGSQRRRRVSTTP